MCDLKSHQMSSVKLMVSKFGCRRGKCFMVTPLTQSWEREGKIIPLAMSNLGWIRIWKINPIHIYIYIDTHIYTLLDREVVGTVWSNGNKKATLICVETTPSLVAINGSGPRRNSTSSLQCWAAKDNNIPCIPFPFPCIFGEARMDRNSFSSPALEILLAIFPRPNCTRVDHYVRARILSDL